jgi:hypothetical protein
VGRGSEIERRGGREREKERKREIERGKRERWDAAKVI